MDFKEIESFEREEDSDSNYTIDPIHGDSKGLAYGIYCKLNGYEHHINFIQNKYKTIASSWMLATFLGMGYLLTGVEVGIPFNALIGIMLICLISAEGIFLLWFLDSGVYHQMLEAVFMETLNLEKKFPFLGKSHENMMKLIYQGKTIPVFFHGLFYSSFIVFLIVISATSTCIYLYKTSKIYSIIVGFLFAVSLFTFRILHKKAYQRYETYRFIKQHKERVDKRKTNNNQDNH